MRLRKLIGSVFLLFFTVGIQAAPLRVFVSVLPQEFFVQQVAGDSVHVQAMVAAGFSPETYQPTPKQVAELAQADLFIRAGMPYEEVWIARFSAVNPAMQVMDMRTGINLLPSSHKHGQDDPHIWTDPVLVKQHAEKLRQKLSQMQPEFVDQYNKNTAIFIAKLDQLDKEIKQLLHNHLQQVFMVFHPAWGYFSQRYQQIQLALEQDGKEPSARQLAALITAARKQQVQYLFVGPQTSPRMAQVLADKLDLQLRVADPLAQDYFKSMQDFARSLAGDF